jgi:hypothetical protein
MRPIDARDGRNFATRVAWIVALPAMVIVLGVMAREGGTNIFNPFRQQPGMTTTWTGLTRSATDLLLPYAAGVTLWPVMPLAMALTAWLITRAPAICFSFGDREAQAAEPRRRAEALSYYTIAPLVFLPVAALCWIIPVFGDWDDVRFWIIAGLVLMLLCVLASWVSTLELLRRALQPSAGRIIGTIALIPMLWALCIGVGAFVMPWVVGLVWLMIDSLR